MNNTHDPAQIYRARTEQVGQQFVPTVQQMNNTHDPAQIYRARTEQVGQQRDHVARRSSINGNISLVLVGAALALAGVWLWRGGQSWLVGAFVLAAGFVISFSYHGVVNRRLLRLTTRYAINDEGLRRLRRDWDTLPLRDPQLADPAHPYAADLDVQGRASLEHLLHTPNTPVGQQTLRRWLLAPAPPATVRARQEAVAALAPQIDWRDELALRGRLMGATQLTYEQFVAWAEAPPLLARRMGLVWLARLLTLIVVVLLGAYVAGLTVAVPLGIVIIVNLLLTLLYLRPTDARIAQVSQNQRVFYAYADLFEALATMPASSAETQRLHADLSAGALRADQQMRRLARMMPLADLRTWIFFFPVQVATLWNIHLLWLLERWQRDAGAQVRGWLTALGESEALVALATLHFDHPDWVFPVLTDGPALAAQQLGHPLLAPTARVGNDLTIGSPGHLLLVTGSNMSGKSTLLRAIGLNVVLAQAGAPVCACAMQLPTLALATSMRVQDSLERGVSYFMAELQRLKLVVDLAEQMRGGKRTLLFLLDEILHGTNSAERQIAAERIIRHLLDQGALGAVSTHDLALATAPELVGDRTLVHFREQFTRDAVGLSMQFDYTLRPGVAPTTNALNLMEMIGLPTQARRETDDKIPS